MNSIIKIAVVALIVLATTSRAHAGPGIPVLDSTNLAQAIQQVTHMVTQIEKLQEQLAKTQTLIDSMKGGRGFGSAFPGGSYDTDLTAEIEDLIDEYNIKNGEAWNLDSASKEFFDKDNSQAASYLKRSMDSLEQSKGRFSDLKGLIRGIDSANDQKAILDLQARIAGEQALLENERIKLAAMKAEAEAQERMKEREAIQLRLSTIKRTPLDW